GEEAQHTRYPLPVTARHVTTNYPSPFPFFVSSPTSRAVHTHTHARRRAQRKRVRASVRTYAQPPPMTAAATSIPCKGLMREQSYDNSDLRDQPISKEDDQLSTFFFCNEETRKSQTSSYVYLGGVFGIPGISRKGDTSTTVHARPAQACFIPVLGAKQRKYLDPAPNAQKRARGRHHGANSIVSVVPHPLFIPKPCPIEVAQTCRQIEHT
ncbi:unnamed protein product, partial [Ectocarpus fasciculatus]